MAFTNIKNVKIRIYSIFFVKTYVKPSLYFPMNICNLNNEMLDFIEFSRS